MPKLSELAPEEYKVVSQPAPAAKPLRLSDLKDEEIKIVEKPRMPTALESGLIGVSQGATLGYSDEGAGILRAGMGKLAGEEGSFSDLRDKYTEEARAGVKMAQESSPGAFGTGQAVGGVISSAIPGLKFLMPSQKASGAANLGKAMLAGGVSGAGFSENKATEAETYGLIGDVATGAALGGTFQLGFNALLSGISALKPQNVRGFAERKAVTAAGGLGSDLKKLQKSGQLHKVGREILDKKIVTAFSSLDDVVERSGEVKEQAGKQIGAALDRVDDLVIQAEKMIDEGKLFGFLPEKAKQGIPGKDDAKKYLRNTFQFNMRRVSDRIKSDLIEPNADNPLLKGELAKLRTIADDFKDLGTRSLKQGNVIKGTQGAVTKFDSETVPQAFKKQIYTIIKNEIDDVVGKTASLEEGVFNGTIDAAKLIGSNLSDEIPTDVKNQTIRSAFEAAKRTYQGATVAGDMAFNRLGSASGNRTVSLTDTIAGAGAIAGGGGLAGGVALGALNKIGRKYGASLQAVGADKLADILSKAPNSLGKFGRILETAAARSPNALISTHMVLTKDPEYRRILDGQASNDRLFNLPANSSRIPSTAITLPAK